MELDTVVDVLDHLWGAFIDPWAMVDPAGTIVACNQHFKAWYAKSFARKAVGAPFDHYIALELAGEDIDVVAQVVERGQPVRYDEVTGYVTDGPNPSLIVAASPVRGDANETRAVLVILRDVTDMARVQAKYRQLTSD